MQKEILHYLHNHFIKPIRNRQFRKACSNKDVNWAKKLLLKGADPTISINKYTLIGYTHYILNKPFKIKNEYLLDQVFNYTRSERTQNEWKNLFSDMIKHSEQIDTRILDRLLYSTCNLFFLKPGISKNCRQAILNMINILILKGATVNKELLNDILHYTYCGINFTSKKRKLLNTILIKYADMKSLSESHKLVRNIDMNDEQKKQLSNQLQLERNNKIIHLCIASQKARTRSLQR